MSSPPGAPIYEDTSPTVSSVNVNADDDVRSTTNMEGEKQSSNAKFDNEAVKEKPSHDEKDGLRLIIRQMKEEEEACGMKGRRLGVTWQNLSVQVKEASVAVKHNVLSQCNLIGQFRTLTHKPPLKTILEDSHGCVKPGEMLLVLGRPGSGCTTLLKLLANRRLGYEGVSGDIHFGSMDHKEALKYRSQIVLNTEEEIFFPTLTVGQTMDFATKLKVPSFRPQRYQESTTKYHQDMKTFLMNAMGISHTVDTKVGNEYVRGVSGGERKRVSIIECLASRGSVFCWDNSTRGLDASSALDWAKCLRSITDDFGLSTVVTLYQAGNGIYNQFDKVLVLDEGKQIYYGSREDARPFLEDLGFICRDGANVADYLTGVTVPTEREIRSGFEHKFPRTAEEIRDLYHQSPIYRHRIKECDYPESAAAKNDTAEFLETVRSEKHKTLKTDSVLTVSLYQQVKACIVRQYQIIWGDKATLAIKQISALIQSIVSGSLFYNASAGSNGLFIKSGALFFAILYNSLMVPISEVTDSFFGRPVLIKHKHFAFFHPAAFCIAQVATDIPITLLHVTIFSFPLYFMVHLTYSATAFFTFWIVIFAVSMCGIAMFRAVGAAFKTFDGASKVSGFLIIALVTFAGYMIQYSKMHPWLGWIYWINPVAYAFESVLSTEFFGKIIDCEGVNLIPSGARYVDAAHQSCAGVGGAIQGQTSLTGVQYLHSLSYSHSHVWRNFGIVWAWWALFVGVTIFFTTRWKDSAETGSSQAVPYEKRRVVRNTNDEESQSASTGPVTASVTGNNITESLVKNTSVFTWKGLTYTVQTPTGDRVLLDNVNGWVKPGMLGALMGSSGAGKTTLLDVLAQRKTDGTIHGSILVDGRPLPISFQRSAGYCEQLDVHEPYATVKEALQFSALLRQPRNTPREEKLAYVDVIIDLLELHNIADTLIGKVGSGLSIEQRKRVTIGVELVSKPSILIFLDEPTSGLDGQSAFNTVRFLRKLADCGQAVLVTIHQPSAQLFAQFDTLLLLAKGGKTVYFGDIGDHAATIKEYFGKNGYPCPPDANPAEYMIDVLSQQDWHEVWLQSPENARTMKELDSIIDEAAKIPVETLTDDNEFAMSTLEQTKIVTNRMNVALFRNTEYVNNKILLHIICGLFNGFSFWKIGNSVGEFQLRLFTIYMFIFVAPGVINQLQPLFIERREVYDAREKKSRMYSWKAFVTGLIVSEFPYLTLCSTFYFCCWYFTVGLPKDSNRAGAIFFIMWLYEFIYTGLGQAIAAYAPNAVFAALANPLILGVIVAFCGTLVPYSQITPFWRYWLYYLNPYTYVSGAMLVFGIYDVKVQCKDSEFAIFDPPSGSTCGDYLASYLSAGEAGERSNLVNPDATSACRVCEYRTGSDYLYTLNLKDYYDGWRNIGITVIFIISSYATVYLMMKMRTKASKKAE
jgi:ABC-type multidrug transport system ATPase subunit